MEEKNPEKKQYTKHHIWCNDYFKPIENCRFCNPKNKKGFWDLYPYSEDEDEMKAGDNLIQKHFPDVIKRT